MYHVYTHVGVILTYFTGFVSQIKPQFTDHRGSHSIQQSSQTTSASDNGTLLNTFKTRLPSNWLGFNLWSDLGNEGQPHLGFSRFLPSLSMSLLLECSGTP